MKECLFFYKALTRHFGWLNLGNAEEWGEIYKYNGVKYQAGGANHATFEAQSGRTYSPVYCVEIPLGTVQQVAEHQEHNYVRNEDTLWYECDVPGCLETNGRDYEMHIDNHPVYVGEVFDEHNLVTSWKNDDNALEFVRFMYKVNGSLVFPEESGIYTFSEEQIGQEVLCELYIGIRNDTNLKIDGSKLTNVKVEYNGTLYNVSGRMGGTQYAPSGRTYQTTYHCEIPFGTVQARP